MDDPGAVTAINDVHARARATDAARNVAGAATMGTPAQNHLANSIAGLGSIPIPARLSLGQLKTSAASVQSKWADMQAQTKIAENQVARFNRDLREELLAQQTVAVWAALAKTLQPLWEAIDAARKQAIGQTDWWSVQSMRAIAANAMDPALSLAMQGRLGRQPLAGLQTFARLAVADGDLALGGLIADEFAVRLREQSEVSNELVEAAAALDQIPLPGRQDALDAINSISATAGLAQLALLGAHGGHGQADPLARLRAYRANQPVS